MDTTGIEAVMSGSKDLISWNLAVIGGSIAVLLGTSYIRPNTKPMRIPYLLFLPGWAMLAISFNFGNQVASAGIMGLFYKNNPEELSEAARFLARTYGKQNDYFYYGLVFFGLWLIIYLFWWIFIYRTNDKTNQT